AGVKEANSALEALAAYRVGVFLEDGNRKSHLWAKETGYDISVLTQFLQQAHAISEDAGFRKTHHAITQARVRGLSVRHETVTDVSRFSTAGRCLHAGNAIGSRTSGSEKSRSDALANGTSQAFRERVDGFANAQ